MEIWKKIKKAVSQIGPGFVTGAADDDPSGIATYSVAGAQFGYWMNWMSLFLLPAMIAIQEMCGRLGMVTGRGLAGVIKKFHSPKLMWFAILLLTIANTINIGADLGIIADSLRGTLGGDFVFWLAVVSTVIVLLEVFVPYKKYSGILKWLSLSLLVYIATAFMVKQDWMQILEMTLVPHIDFGDSAYLMTMVGFLGTTISPYLFFWQASEEVEEQIADDRSQISDFGQKPKINLGMIKRMKFDTKLGMVFSNTMTFFIILTTAATLHRSGMTNIETPQQAAEAIRPLVGDFAYLLFALGMIGMGLQSIPILAGSLAYAVADGLGIERGLSKRFMEAKGFYLVILLATFIGAGMNMWGVSIMDALFYSAVVNGVMAVPLIFIIIRLADDKRIVGQYTSTKRARLIAWTTFCFMILAVALMVGSKIV